VAILTTNDQPINPLTPTVIIHVGTAIKHPVPDRVKQSYVIFDIRAL